MVRGGYKLIDLKDNDFTVGGASVTIAGTYAAIDTSKKETIIGGYKIAGAVRPESPVRFLKSGDNYVGTIVVAWTNTTSAIAYIITVTPADAVTIATATINSAA